MPEGNRNRSWRDLRRRFRPDRLAVRLVGGTYVILLLTEIFASDIDDYLYPNDLLGRTLTDIVVLAFIVLPVFYFALYRPLFRILRERAQSEEALRLRAWEMGALNAVSEVAAREHDLERLLVRVLHVLLSVFESQGGWIQLGGYGESPPPRIIVSRGFEPPFGVPASGHCVDCPTHCWGIIEDLPQGDVGLIEECRDVPREALRAAGFEGYVGLLVPVGRHFRAVVNLAWREPRTLTDAEKGLLRSVARQLGIAAENAALDTAEQAARDRADAIASVGLALGQTLDLDAVLRLLFENLRRFVSYDRAKVMLVEGASKLRVRAVFTPSPETDPAGRPFGTFDVIDSPCVSEVLTTRRSLCVADMQRLALVGRFEEGFERSWLGVPLLAEGEAIGLLTLVKEEPGFYKPEQVKLAEVLVATASAAVANARLFGEVQSSRKRLETLSRKLVEVQESERRHLARELHDEVGQSLAAILCRLGILREMPSPSASSVVDEMMQIADHTLRTVRDLSLDLHPALLEEAGLAETLRWYIDRQVRSGSLKVGLSVSPKAAFLASDVRNACFRVAQEALTNVVRHAGARHVRVRLRVNGTTAELVVQDDGRGFDVDEACQRARTGSSLGLLAMRERAELQGGQLVLESRLGQGTTVRASFPVSGAGGPGSSP